VYRVTRERQQFYKEIRDNKRFMDLLIKYQRGVYPEERQFDLGGLQEAVLRLDPKQIYLLLR
jgi:hypothetical protein